MKRTLNEVSPPNDNVIQALLMANNTVFPKSKARGVHVG